MPAEKIDNFLTSDGRVDLNKVIESGYEGVLDFFDSMSIAVPACARRFEPYRFQINVWNKEFDRAQENLKLRLEQGSKFGRLDTLYIVYLYQKLGNKEEAIYTMKEALVLDSLFIENAEANLEKFFIVDKDLREQILDELKKTASWMEE